MKFQSWLVAGAAVVLLVVVAWAVVGGWDAVTVLVAGAGAAAGAAYMRQRSSQVSVVARDAEALGRRDIARLAARTSGAAATAESERRAEWDAHHEARPRPKLRALPDDEDTQP